MKSVNYAAKAAHYQELAARAAYQAAACQASGFVPEAEEWADRAARYDAQAASYTVAARRAA